MNWIHWQNLSDNAGIVRHGRAWAFNERLNWEWFFGFCTPKLAITKSEGGSLWFQVSCGLCQFFLKISHLLWRSRERETSISCFDWRIWIRVWGDPNDSAYDHKVVISYGNWLLGKVKYTSVSLEERDTVVPMPEGSYACHVKFTRDTWKRRFWPGRTVTRVTIALPKGIPHQGKGENSWDCGDDATYGMTCPARNIEEGIGRLVGSCLHDRKRYGETSATWGKVVMA